jgi:hypothetical protein
LLDTVATWRSRLEVGLDDRNPQKGVDTRKTQTTDGTNQSQASSSTSLKKDAFTSLRRQAKLHG